jgi:hypothetical protein
MRLFAIDCLSKIEEMVVCRSARMDGFGVQQSSDGKQWPTQMRVVEATDFRAATAGVIQPHDQSHGGRLARTVGSEKSCDGAWIYDERQVVDHQFVPIALAQSAHLDRIVHRESAFPALALIVVSFARLLVP